MSKQANHISIFLATGKILAMVLNFAVPLFLTRFLTKSDYGLYCQFNTVFLFLGSILGMGLQSNLYFFGSNSDSKEKYVSVTFILLCFFSTIGILLLSIPFISHLFMGGGELSSYSALICCCIWLYIPTRITDPLFTLNKDPLFSVLFPTIEIAGKVIFIIIFSLIFHSLEAVLWAVVVFQLLCFTITFGYSVKSGLRFPVKDFRAISKQILTYALPFGGAVILSTLASRFDKLIGIQYLSAEDYAIYSLAFFGIPGIMQIYDSLCQVNVLEMSKCHLADDRLGLLSCYRRFVCKTLSFSMPIIIGVILFAKPMMTFLFSEEYAESVPLFQVYVTTFIIAMFGSGAILRAIGKTKLTLLAFAISAIVFIPATFFLLKYFGIWGGMIGALLGNILPKLIQVIIELCILQCSLTEYFPIREIVKIVLCSVIFAIPLVVLTCKIDFSFWWALMTGAIYVTLVYIMEIRFGVFAFSIRRK